MTEPDLDALADKIAERMRAMAARPSLRQMAIASGVDGWSCPRCGCEDWRVYKTAWNEGGRKRTRMCRNCGQEIRTVETPVTE